MAEQHGNEKPFTAIDGSAQDKETAQIIERVNGLITGFGESIYELVQKNSGIDLREADFTKSENAELNQAIQNVISEYIQNLNNLNADLSGKIGESINGFVTNKDQKDV
ncbi:hypothetical protein [Bacillus paralicheniformis]|uniref:hypothetical protein n=1 Tax=Bacillus paralicheniformis TaxID=1648923 RepID=UPI00128E71BB|nr:hypothetical protein [Bacillus paralicheniformis]MPQ26181.1 hypothetical protein [Bacillus paralicheniformis]